MANKPDEANFFPDVPQFPSMGTFQPVYGKFDLTTYIQGASDYEIMAFLVGKYNACLEAYGNITKLSTDTITACKQLQDWINSWFTNLDVQEELNNKIDSMVADGSFGRIIHEQFDEQLNQQTKNAVTEWLVANVTPTGSAVVVDKTLSIGGAAADAKAVGTNCFIYRGTNYKGDLDTTLKEGNYGLNSDTYNHTKGLELLAYSFMIVYKGTTLTGGDNPDVTQFIITFDETNSYKYFVRSSFARVFPNFIEVNKKDNSFKFLGSQYKGDLDTTFTPGYYGLITDTYNHTKGLDLLPFSFLIIYKGTTLTTGENYDVTQIIITFDYSNNFKFFIRSSIVKKFTDFVEIGKSADGNFLKQKVCFIGDSFTDELPSVPSRHSFVYYLNQLTTKYEVTNYGVSGATAYSWYTDNHNKITSDYDTFFIALGLNYSTDEPMDNDGTLDDNIESHTFCGSMNAIISKILEVNPKARVIIWCMDSWYAEHRSTTCKNLADKWGCEYYSMKADAKIPIRNGGKFDNVMPGLSSDVVTAKNKAYYYSYPSDGHPNNAAQLMLATYLCNII